jgi:hypothetical protein
MLPLLRSTQQRQEIFKRTRLEEEFIIIDNPACFLHQRGTQIGHVSLGKFSNFKRRSVIAMGGSASADVGREAGGSA